MDTVIEQLIEFGTPEFWVLRDTINSLMREREVMRVQYNQFGINLKEHNAKQAEIRRVVARIYVPLAKAQKQPDNPPEIKPQAKATGVQQILF